MIGILYPSEMLLSLRNGGRSFEKPELYLSAARDIGEEIIFMSLKDIHWKRKSVWAWNGQRRDWLIKPIPDVIINRTRSNDAFHRRSIARLKRMGKIVFNERNIYSKLNIHRILSRNPQLIPFLPATSPVTVHAVKHMLEESPCLFLKPKRASVGNGIIRVSMVEKKMFAEVNQLGRTKRRRVGVEKLVRMVGGSKRDYLVQQGIPLMNYEGSPVDFRVSVQKDGSGCWQCTGIVGKVARKKAIVTNLHCGGKSIKASELFKAWKWNGAEAEQKMKELGIKIAQTIDTHLPNVADLGLDIAFDERQHPWFIEANFRDLRITFRGAGEKKIWTSTFANPVRYAAYCLRRHKEGMHNAGEVAKAK